MPLLVNRGYEALAGEKGSTITIPLPSAIVAQDVTPGATPPSTADVAPTSVTLTMNKWKEAPFYLTDKELAECMTGTIPGQASEAIRAIANVVNNDIFALYKNVYGFAGTAGTTPFGADVTAYVNARKAVNKQLGPKNDRRVIMDDDAEANALLLRAFQDASFRGDTLGIIEGQINRKLGADWFASSLVPTHTAGTAAGATTNSAGYAAGIKTITLASAGTGTVLVGDIITFAGHAQTYTVVTGDADVSNGGTVVFEPGLAVALAASPIAITLKATHVANMLFQRDAFAFASRPFSNADAGQGNFLSTSDPKSGLTLRLELTREYKRWRWAFDILYGTATPRPEYAARIAG